MLVPMLWVLPGQALIVEATSHHRAVPRVHASVAVADAPRIDKAIVQVRSTTESATTGPVAVSTPTTDFDIPQVALTAYQHAANVLASVDSGCRLPWTLLAAIGKVESDNGSYHGGRLDSHGVAQPALFGPVLDGKNGFAAIADTDAGALDHDTRWDRAVGPMQFLPSTWRVVAVDGDGDGIRNPQDIDDAALAAAVYLCAGHQDLATVAGARAAALRYNHSTSYAALVLHYDQLYRGLDSYPTLPMGGSLGPVGLRVVAAQPAPHGAENAHGRSQGEAMLLGSGVHQPATTATPTPPKPPASPGSAPTSSPASGTGTTTTLAGTWATCAQGYCVGNTVLTVPVDVTAAAPADLDGDGATGTWAQELTGLVGQQVKLTVRHQGEDDVVVTINDVDVVPGSSPAPAQTPSPTPPPQTPSPTPPPQTPSPSAPPTPPPTTAPSEQPSPTAPTTTPTAPARPSTDPATDPAADPATDPAADPTADATAGSATPEPPAPD
jgi:hypothetical protein